MTLAAWELLWKSNHLLVELGQYNLVDAMIYSLK
jgi:hypothetical protein